MEVMGVPGDCKPGVICNTYGVVSSDDLDVSRGLICAGPLHTTAYVKYA